MRLNRKSIAVGLALGALVGGAGAALAASGTSTSPTPTPLHGVGSRYIGAGFHAGAMRGVMPGQGAPIAAAASYLGLSKTQLQTQLQSGKTLAQIAKAQGKPVSGLESAMIEAITTNINADSALSSSQKASILAQMKGRLATMVNATCPRVGGAGRAGGFGPMMMRG
ncbi:MAG TPA: hypothetical protein VMH26_04565 [Burkholderiales bacterium]|nr:hypothetical protein [Burkholderiales bacterium]